MTDTESASAPTSESESEYSVLDALIVIIADETDKVILPDSGLVDELGLDSLDLVVITQHIEQRWPLVGTIDYDPATMRTPRELARVIEGRIGNHNAL